MSLLERVEKITDIIPNTQKVFEILESLDEHKRKDELAKRIRRIKNAVQIKVILTLVQYSIYAILVLDISYGLLSIQSFFYAILVSLLVNGLASYISNIYAYYQHSFIELAILNKVIHKIAKILDTKDKSLPNDFSTNISGITLKLINLSIDLIVVVFSLMLLIFSTINLHTKITLVSVATLSLITMAIAGFFYTKLSKTVYKTLIAEKDINKKQMFQRWLFPTVHNIIILFGPLMTVLLLKLEISAAVVQVALLATVLTGNWNLVENIQRFFIAKISLDKMHNKIKLIERKYVINNYGFKKTARLTAPSKEVLMQSKTGLVLRNFMPMRDANLKQANPRQFTVTFIPGLYQLNGVNGIGKTTLLKTLTLPNNGTRVEIPQGEIALYNQPFYDPKSQLSVHRKKYIYIGNSSKQVDPNSIDKQKFEKYTNIQKFLHDINKTNREHSEGEKAVLLICNAYTQILGNQIKERLLFIDEAISRIYADETYNLRQEVTNLTKEITLLDKEIIVIVVDHMTKIPEATQIYMDKNVKIHT